MVTTTLKNIKSVYAIDITKSDEEVKGKTLTMICMSSGVYGINGALFMDENGTLYKITKRSTVLFKYL